MKTNCAQISKIVILGVIVQICSFYECLSQVGRRMERKKADAETLQTPSYKSVGFNRDLYFNPGLYEDTSRFPD